MFTGIVTAMGDVQGFEEDAGILRLTVTRPPAWDITLGQSIAVNGACLTVVSYDDRSMVFELMKETLDRTMFGIALPAQVNLERAMLANGRFDGHMVQGHIDTVGQVASLTEAAESVRLVITHDAAYDRWVIEKGSIAINGVSLTVASCLSGEMVVALIPHTLQYTTLAKLQAGDPVNLEFDILAKYICK